MLDHFSLHLIENALSIDIVLLLVFCSVYSIIAPEQQNPFTDI